MALIFFLATLDAVRLLGAIRSENKILRDAALQRTIHLESVRSYVLLTHSYLGDYFLDSDEQQSQSDRAKMRDAWSHLSSDIASYRPNTLDEEVLVRQLRGLLDQHWQTISDLMGPAERKPRDALLYTEEILPLRTSIVDITTQLEGIDAKQAATTEAQMEGQFEHLGARLSFVLSLGLGAAILLATGCFLYIFRIERQNRERYGEVQRARQALEQLSAKLVDAQETERRTISRELHDQVGQTLNALLVDAANLSKRVQPEDALSLRYLDNIRKYADSSVNSIRDIALLLRPSMLDDLGLIPALEWQAREVSRRSGIKVKVSAENVTDSLPDDMRTCIYRVVQEALQNVLRHSGAKSAMVTVRQDAHSLYLSVEDDGHGFDPKLTRGMGMLGMEERVRQLGGQYQIQSTPGTGTVLRVTLSVPVAVS
jgi:signal transduction histidine kinase